MQTTTPVRECSANGARLARIAEGDRGQWRWWSVIVLLFSLAAVFLAIAAIGAAEAARDQRVLSFLDPAVEVVRTAGWQTTLWLLGRSAAVGGTITAITAMIALSGVVICRRRGAPLVLLGMSVSLAAWGQILLLADRPLLGAWLYGGGMVCAALLGIWRPLPRIDGFPWLPLPKALGSQAGIPAAAPLHLHWGSECAVVVLLTAAALLTRIYALTELPQGFDLEMIDSIMLSRTVRGLVHYLHYGFTMNSTGIVHLLPKKVLFDLFGTSVYSLRLSAVVFSLATTPLLYWLVRRVAGVVPAVGASVLFIAAPEQLYWSRIENANFAPIALLGLVTAHLGLWMVERCSFGAVLAAALWMPACRYFYAPGYIMFAYPLVLYGHAIAFVRGAWRKAWYVVPVLGAGLGLWIFSLSILYSYLNNQWRFVHPAFIFGAPAWRMHGEADFRDASLSELVRLQAIAMAGKTGEVVTGLADHGPRMFSQWFLRACASPNHVMVLNAGVAVMLALGVAYLFGQFYERRAFVLLLWVGLGLLPAVLSNEPTTRRLATLFPAIPAIAGVMMAAAVRIVRASAGVWLSRLTAVVVGAVIAVIAWTSLASHYRVAMGPVYLAPAIRFAQPLLAGSDVILHNLEPAVAKGIVLGNLDQFLASPSCVHSVAEKDWLRAALDPPCDFNGYVSQLTLPPERREALQRAFNPKRVTFLFEETLYSHPHVELLRGLYPLAEVKRSGFAQNQRSLVSMTVDIGDVRALHNPALIVKGNGVGTTALEKELLSGVTLVPAEGTAAGEGDAVAPSIVVRGGLLVERDGWYRFEVGPGCEEAAFTLDGREANEARPMLAGVHPFEISVPSPIPCHVPLRVTMQAAQQAVMMPVPPKLFVNEAVSSLPQVLARPVAPYGGYGEARVLAQLVGGGMDMGVDAEGHVTVLVMQEGVRRVQQFDPEGREVARWYPRIPPERFVHGMAVDRDGAVIFTAETTVLLYDRHGNQVGAWETPWAAIPTDIAVAPDGRILLAVPSRNSVAVFSRDGKLEGELTQFRGRAGRLSQPRGIAVGPDGDMMVIQDDGQVVLLRITDSPETPTYGGTFRADFGVSPVTVRGSAFDGPDQLLIPDPSTTTPLVYSAQGERMMAAVPARDLSVKALGQVIRFRPTPDRLYALESTHVWSIAR